MGRLAQIFTKDETRLLNRIFASPQDACDYDDYQNLRKSKYPQSFSIHLFFKGCKIFFH